jgi:hypothetical protein
MDSIITNCIAVVRPKPLDNYVHQYTQKIMAFNGYQIDERNCVVYLLVRGNLVFRVMKRTAITSITAADISQRHEEVWRSGTVPRIITGIT